MDERETVTRETGSKKKKPIREAVPFWLANKMVSVAYGSMVHMIREGPSRRSLFPEYHLKPIEEVLPGEYVLGENDCPVRVHDVVRYPALASHILFDFMGLCASPLQPVKVSSSWQLVGRLGYGWHRERCRGLAGLVVESGSAVRIDGVLCKAHTLADVATDALPYRRVGLKLRKAVECPCLGVHMVRESLRFKG